MYSVKCAMAAYLEIGNGWHWDKFDEVQETEHSYLGTQIQFISYNIREFKNKITRKWFYNICFLVR